MTGSDAYRKTTATGTLTAIATPDKDVGRLLDAALAQAHISQYRLAQRLADIRGVAPRSADQALRRIRRLGQVPTEDVARHLAEAFRPELDLAPDHFYIERSQVNQSFRDALDEIEALRQRVMALEHLLQPQPPEQPGDPKRPREEQG